MTESASSYLSDAIDKIVNEYSLALVVCAANIPLSRMEGSNLPELDVAQLVAVADTRESATEVCRHIAGGSRIHHDPTFKPPVRVAVTTIPENLARAGVVLRTAAEEYAAVSGLMTLHHTYMIETPNGKAAPVYVQLIVRCDETIVRIEARSDVSSEYDVDQVAFTPNTELEEGSMCAEHYPFRRFLKRLVGDN